MISILLEKAAHSAKYAVLSKRLSERQFNNKLFKNQARKRRPGFVRDLIHYPQSNPVFIALSWNGLNQLRHIWGSRGCLLCNADAALYDFEVLAGREAWIIQHPYDSADAVRLGKFVQLGGAAKVVIIPMGGFHA